jgi:preprotein translocase subunit SecF
MTSLTTLTVVIVLFAAGGEILRDFALALIIGVLVGTYSSVFVASPIIVEWEHRAPKRFK